MKYLVISKNFKNNRLENTCQFSIDNIRDYFKAQKNLNAGCTIYKCDNHSYILILEWPSIQETIIEYIEAVKK